MLPVLEQLKKIGYDGVEVPIFGGERRSFDSGASGSTTWASSAPPSRSAPMPTIPSRRMPRCAPPASKPPNARSIAARRSAPQSLCGPYHSAIGLFSGKGPTQDEWKWGVESMRHVAEHAESAGVMLAVEYLNRFETYFLTCAADTVRVHQRSRTIPIAG